MVALHPILDGLATQLGNANVDLPEGFVFDYFGTEYNGSNASDRVHIGRMGNMHLANDGSTAVQTMSNSYYFYNQMRDLPYSGSTYYKPGLLALVQLLHKLLLS